MSTRRLGVGVAVLNGYLYAVGGSDGTSPLNTGLYYDIGVNLYLFCSDGTIYRIVSNIAIVRSYCGISLSR